MGGETIIAEIKLLHPELVLTRTIAAVPEMVAELEYQSIVDRETYYLFFKVHGGDFGAFDDAAATDPTVSESTVIIDGGDFRVYRMRLLRPERLVLAEAARLGIRILRAKSGGGGWVATLEVPDVELLHRFRAHCAGKDVGFTVERLYHADDERRPDFGLTPVQRETLVAAYRSGYFDEPRGGSVRELADALGVSTSAISGRLRRGMRNLVENALLR